MTFHGVRGSTPCHGPELVGYGGNTSCVSVDIDGEAPIVLDLGTGLRYFGHSRPVDEPFRGTCLVSHLHWDHIQGLPFFTPLLREGSRLTVYAPVQEGGRTAAQIFADSIRPPLFPVDLAVLPGIVDVREIGDSSFAVGSAEVTARSIPHLGATLGYRIDAEHASVAYLSDHQMPLDGSFAATANAKELCRDVDLLIHDAQFTPAEFARKRDWGHCTIEFAMWMAAEAGAKRLALFHHDPTHSDDVLDRLGAVAEACGRSAGIEVFMAREGMTVQLGSS